jgi:hypothetical protein
VIDQFGARAACGSVRCVDGTLCRAPLLTTHDASTPIRNITAALERVGAMFNVAEALELDHVRRRARHRKLVTDFIRAHTNECDTEVTHRARTHALRVLTIRS